METELAVCLALDHIPVSRAVWLTSQLGKRVYAVKIHSLFDEGGAELVWQLKQVGARRVWVDAKLHDSPDTVRERVAALARAGADIVTVHADGGVAMMRAAREGAAVRADSPVTVWAVTVLTSLTVMDIPSRPIRELALERALLAEQAELTGFTCPAHEVQVLTNTPQLRKMLAVVPGTRSLGVPQHDQKRSVTPTQAIKWGAHMLVVGREVTKADDPLAAFNAFANEVEAARKNRCAA